MMAMAIKRALDFFAALALLILLSPLLAVLALCTRFAQGRPVLFTQVRPGKNARPFSVFKFRTMTYARDAEGGLLAEDQRITRWGKFLRSTSLDELPQLWNVLKGEMSLVGPRPFLMHYLERYSAEQFRRHNMRPGITGWAQINGRNLTTWEDRLACDVWYVDHWSLRLDFRIIFRTFAQVFSGKGISPRDRMVMPEFMGSGAPTLPAARAKGQAPSL